MVLDHSHGMDRRQNENDFGNEREQPMKMASNKALQVTAHKAAPNLNADVGSGKMSCRAHNGTSTTDDAKVTNHAGTISESEARNSR